MVLQSGMLAIKQEEIEMKNHEDKYFNMPKSLWFPFCLFVGAILFTLGAWLILQDMPSVQKYSVLVAFIPLLIFGILVEAIAAILTNRITNFVVGLVGGFVIGLMYGDHPQI